MAKSNGLATTSVEQRRVGLRKKVRYFYDLQRLRLQMSGRLSKSKDDTVLDEADRDVLDGYAAEIEGLEERALKDIEKHLKGIPFYSEVLSDKDRFVELVQRWPQ